MKRKTTVMILILLLFVPLSSYSLENDSTSDIIIIPTPRIWGLDLHLAFPFSLFHGDINTVFWIELGAGYERIGFFRKPDGSPYNGSLPGFDPEISPYYTRQNFQLQLGLEQGLLWNECLNANLFDVFVFYKLRYDAYIQDQNPTSPQLIFSCDYPDKEGIFQNSLLLGVIWNELDRNYLHNMRSGMEFEASVELAPEFLANTIFGLSDFIRYNLTFCAFIPIFDIAPDSFANVLSAYCGFLFTADYLSGDHIPINALRTIGGRRPKPALGYSVRGLEPGRFDSRLKVAGNFDLRINLPEIANNIIQPGCIFYVDAGYYNFIDFDEQGIIYTTGGGLYFTILEMINICFYSQVLLNEDLIRGGSFLPFAFELSFHF